MMPLREPGGVEARDAFSVVHTRYRGWFHTGNSCTAKPAGPATFAWRLRTLQQWCPFLPVGLTC